MMNVIRTVAVACALVAGAPLASAADSIDSGAISGAITPGVYGRVDMASRASPTLVYEQAMFVERPATEGKVEPLYLHVPPEHAKNWKKHCKQYDACSRPVFFVKSAEYEPGYTPPKAEPADKTKKRKFRNGW